MSRVYDLKRWRGEHGLRKQALRRDRYRCVICHAWVGGKGMARVDHIHMVKDAPHRATDLTNLRTLCTVCDAKRHSDKGSKHKTHSDNRLRDGCDADGMPLDPKHQWSIL